MKKNGIDVQLVEFNHEFYLMRVYFKVGTKETYHDFSFEFARMSNIIDYDGIAKRLFKKHRKKPVWYKRLFKKCTYPVEIRIMSINLVAGAEMVYQVTDENLHIRYHHEKIDDKHLREYINVETLSHYLDVYGKY